MYNKSTEETIATEDEILKVISGSFTVVITFRKSKIKEAKSFFTYMVAMDYISFDKLPKPLDENSRCVVINGFGTCSYKEITKKLTDLVETIKIK